MRTFFNLETAVDEPKPGTIWIIISFAALMSINQ